MIDISTIIIMLEPTGYIIEPAKADEQELFEDNLIHLSVGYGPIRSQHPEQNIAFSPYNLSGENNIQSFYIKIICPIEDFRTAFITVYKTLIGQTPSQQQIVTTSLTYANGEPLGINNNSFWFLMEWKIGFNKSEILRA